MPWAGSVVEQRNELVRLVLAGYSIGGAAARLGVSRQTGTLWWNRYVADGVDGLLDQSRVPGSSPNRTTVEMEQLVCGVRDRYPAWGGRKIRGFLLRQGQVGVPAPSTITQILRRNGYLPASPPPRNRYVQVGSFQAEVPNDMWQIDFKGDFALSGGGRCFPLGVLDDHSRYNLCLQACPNQRRQTVQRHLEAVFATYGLPRRFLTDNGPPWGTSNRHHRWTPLKVWLVDLGIVVVHSRPRHPQTLGKQERFHSTLDRELLSLNAPFRTLGDVQDGFDKFRTTYNQQRPHESLGQTVVPADRYRPSPRPLPTSIDPPDYPPHWTVLTVAADAAITITGTRHKIGKPFIGKPVAIHPETGNVYYRNTPIGRTITPKHA